MGTVNAPSSENSSILGRGSQRGHDAHFVRFYTDDSAYLDALHCSIEEVLRAGDAAVVIATEAHRTGLASRRKAGRDAAATIIEEGGRYVLMDAGETLSKFMSRGMPDSVCFAQAIGIALQRARKATKNGKGRIFAFGEMVSVLWAEGKFDAAVALERLWNQLGETHAFTLHCAYPMKGFDREEHGEYFLKICAEHSTILPEENRNGEEGKQDVALTAAYLQQKVQALQTVKREREEAEELLHARKRELAELLENARTLELTNQGLRDLSARLLHFQDEERRRIARDLHDSTGQTLALLGMTLSTLESQAKTASPELARGLAENAEIVRQVSVELRTLSYLLHPPLLDEAGLASALRWLIDGFGQRSGILVGLELPGRLERMPQDLETGIYRIVQECLTNIHRHSESPVACVRISEISGAIVLEVADQGKGIDDRQLSQIASSRSPGIGLRGIRERIQNFRGDFEIASDAKGTRIRVVIPIDNERFPGPHQATAI